MADFLSNIVAQSIGSMESVQPLITPLFAPPSLPALEPVLQPIDFAPIPAPEFAPALESPSFAALSALPTLVPLTTPDLDLTIPFFDDLPQEDDLSQEPLVASDEAVVDYTNTSRGVGLPRPMEEHIEARAEQAMLGADLSERREGRAITRREGRVMERSENSEIAPSEGRAMASIAPTLTPSRDATRREGRGDACHRPALTSHNRPETPEDSLETMSMEQVHVPTMFDPISSQVTENPISPFPETPGPETRVGARFIAPHAGTSQDAPVTESPLAPPPSGLKRSINPASMDPIASPHDSVNTVHPTPIARPAISFEPTTRVGARFFAPHAGTSQDAPVIESPPAPYSESVGVIHPAPTDDSTYRAASHSLRPHEILPITPGTPALQALVQQQLVPHRSEQPQDQTETTILPALIKEDMQKPSSKFPAISERSVLGTSQLEQGQVERQSSSIPQEMVEEQPAPIIRVSIGRIEVRASIPTTRSEPTRAVEPVPALSLSEYLSQRRGGLR